MKTISVCAALFCVIAATPAQTQDTRTYSSHYFSTFFGQSQLILGSEDRRTGGGFAYGYGKPDPGFRFKNIPAQRVYEIYGDKTVSLGVDRKPGDYTYAVGVLMYSRHLWPISPAGWGAYFDFGWGLQYANQATHDLDSHLNSTPVLGFGGSYKIGEHELLLGVRFLHISNAGFKGKNRGQNELFMTATYRY